MLLGPREERINTSIIEELLNISAFNSCYYYEEHFAVIQDGFEKLTFQGKVDGIIPNIEYRKQETVVIATAC